MNISAINPWNEVEERAIALLTEQGHELETYQSEGGTRGIIRACKLLASNLRANHWNPNSMNVRQGEALEESLAEYGQVIEVVVRPTAEDWIFEIIDGEHRFNRLDQEVSVNILFGFTDDEARKLTLTLNETRGEADKIKMAQLLADLATRMNADKLRKGLAFGENEMEELVKLADVNWDQFDESEDFGEGSDNEDEDPDKEQWQTILVKMPLSAYDVYKQAYSLVKDERDGLHDDAAIAHGQVLESIAADYIAGPH